MDNPQNIKHNSDEIDVIALLKYALHKWYVFAIALAICIGVAVLYYLQAAPQYATSASIIIRNESANPLTSISFGGISAADFLGTSSSVENNIEIMKSRQLFAQLIKELDLRVTTTRRIGWRKIDQYYDRSPLTVTCPDDFVAKLRGSLEIKVHKNKKGNYSLRFKRKVDKTTTKFKCNTTDLSAINTPWGVFSFTEYPEKIIIPQDNDGTYTVYFNMSSLKSQVDALSSDVTISLVNKKSEAITISYQSNSPRKNEDIVTKLIELYNRGELNEQVKVQSDMLYFINDRLKVVANDLTNIENTVEDYKKDHNIADISTQAQLFIQTSSEYEQRIAEADIQYSLVSFVENYLRDATDSDLIPNNTGIQDQSLAKLMADYNELVIKYLRISRTTNETNPVLDQTLAQIRMVRSNILQTIRNVKESINITKRDLQHKNSEFTKQINDVPTLEREYVAIERDREIKQGIYISLLQKRELIQIQLASNVEAARIIDPAYTSESKVAPRLSLLLFLAGVLGCAAAAAYLYLAPIFAIAWRKDDEPAEA